MNVSIMLRIYLFRHGETFLNRAGIVQGAGVDASVTLQGFHQAIGVGANFFANNIPPHQNRWSIICSTMTRTRETLLGFCHGAHGVAPDDPGLPPADVAFLPSELFGVPITLDARLKEKAQGARENKKNNITQEVAEAMELELGNPPSSFFKETDSEVASRALEVLEEEIVRRIVAENDPNYTPSSSHSTLLVTHGGVIRVLLRDIFKVGGGPGEERIRVFNSSVSRVDVSIKKRANSEVPGVNTVRVGEDVYEWTATLVGPIGDTSYIPPHLVTERSDW
ncbi:hypothetical protein TrLO_g11794 [Triparma laevis f. longispina]|uniref:Phosphoglycerate mutase n=1 Tax=Triparma laevis f. longispina TaxID=1714387 RepID=A0A9W7CAS0_9STRA|nr:hypothetical protein TrLO_g11794 [Triparma laevis f. longispina]